MNLKDYIVKKEFLSHDSKRCYKPGEIYNGGDSFHTKMLLKHGFIEEFQLSEPKNNAIHVLLALINTALAEEN